MTDNLKADFTVLGAGSIYLLTAHSADAGDWVDSHLHDCGALPHCVAVECRFIQDICFGILGDGLTIEMDGRPMIVQDECLILDFTAA